jgi:hypothetical protein
VAEIERDALDDDVPMATALRKCIVLGGKSGSEALRDWASRELQGYHGEDELPDYRVIAAPIVIDGMTATHQIEGQQIAPSALPDFVREHVREEVELRDGVGAIQALVDKDEIRLGLPMASEIAAYMNAESDNPYQRINRIYWNVSPVVVRGVLDRIRTALTQLVAELRANMRRDEDIPSAEAANQAVNVVVSGKRSRVQITTAQASGSATTATATTSRTDVPPEESAFWTRSRRIGAIVVGSATVVAAVVAVVQFL